MLSANIVSSCGNVVFFLDTAGVRAGNTVAKNKGRERSRPSGTFTTLQVSTKYYFGGSVALGAGFGVVVEPAGFVPGVSGLDVVGFGAAPVVAGAGTPDCTL
jgi:hypothetical protein